MVTESGRTVFSSFARARSRRELASGTVFVEARVSLLIMDLGVPPVFPDLEEIGSMNRYSLLVRTTLQVCAAAIHQAIEQPFGFGSQVARAFRAAATVIGR